MADNYDRIARFYDVDMARNMRFDDIGFYASVCARHPGRVLELGCGTGRILLELLDRGIDVTGVDASAAMLEVLRRKAAARGLGAPVAQMDLHRLALDAVFDVVLCPYSLVTYLTADDALLHLLAAIDAVLSPAGVLVLDAFVPRPVTASNRFTLDYERPYAAGSLARWKRVVPLGATNRIERRYCVTAADGTPVETIDVTEVIRPYAPDALLEALSHGGYHVEATYRDYSMDSVPLDAQYFTVIASPLRSSHPAPTAA